MNNITDKNIVYHIKFVRNQSSRKRLFFIILSFLYADCTFTYRKMLQCYISANNISETAPRNA